MGLLVPVAALGIIVLISYAMYKFLDAGVAFWKAGLLGVAMPSSMTVDGPPQK